MTLKQLLAQDQILVAPRCYDRLVLVRCTWSVAPTSRHTAGYRSRTPYNARFSNEYPVLPPNSHVPLKSDLRFGGIASMTSCATLSRCHWDQMEL